jgi:hypothetical protein
MNDEERLKAVDEAAFRLQRVMLDENSSIFDFVCANVMMAQALLDAYTTPEQRDGVRSHVEP